MQLRPILFSIILLFCLNTSSTANPLFLYSDSSSMPISYNEFEEKMSYYTDMMKQESEFTIEEYIEMVLVDNTYFLFMRNSNPLYKVQTHNEYLDFFQRYMDDIVIALEATEQGCNGGLYSAKYQLCIGGTDPTTQSVYQITE